MHIMTAEGWRLLQPRNLIPAIPSPGFFNEKLAATRVQRHEALFIDGNGRHLLMHDHDGKLLRDSAGRPIRDPKWRA